MKEIDTIVKYWIESSNRDHVTMQNLLKSKDYSWSLFLGHLVIEKLLKAHYVKKFQTHAVFTHDLLRLAKKTELDLPANYLDWLDEITTFNLNTRYPDYKQNFYKLCTKKFTFTQIERIESIRTWLKNQF
jgi:HEPN domain-containing protein